MAVREAALKAAHVYALCSSPVLCASSAVVFCCVLLCCAVLCCVCVQRVIPKIFREEAGAGEEKGEYARMVRQLNITKQKNRQDKGYSRQKYK
jgi:hypothetical protein